ncbi:circadian clock KaiB family protein [Vacuolonema iberomarrocanum]|uniref:circadian clock KaiB family protein n=1 Tax=Vacuolonema iberomarrocanum TaxID=3454632 RepID=UPI001A090004|nr:circadian clock KaiB family protein [filamentous cyanobacterium LEGE 07170]
MSPEFSPSPPLPALFKGLALFTPGGDMVYCIDPDKKQRWHLQLCALLQELLNLAEPPHFLVPCYTATIDRWRDPKTQEIIQHAEAYPLVMQHQALLNAAFGTGSVVWQTVPQVSEMCDRPILERYRHQFPTLWDNHDLIVQFAGNDLEAPAPFHTLAAQHLSSAQQQESFGYILRLYVAGNTTTTETILRNLHGLLEQTLNQPYTLRVIDIYKHPEQAESDRITATPTLVRVHPRPVRRLVGEMKEVDQLLQVFASFED